MTASLLPISLDTALDANGNPIAGAQLRFFETGTDTPAAVYLDATLTTPAAIPVLADAAGRFPALYADTRDGDLRARLFDAAGVAIGRRDIDPITDNFSTGAGKKLLSNYGAISGVTDDSATLQAAIDDLSVGDILVFDVPRVFISTTVLRNNVPDHVTIDFNYCELIADPAWVANNANDMFVLRGANGVAVTTALAAHDYSGGTGAGVYDPGMQRLKLVSTTGVAVGDLVEIKSTRPALPSIPAVPLTEVGRVHQIDGTTVWLDAPLLCAFETGDVVEVRKTATGCTFKNGVIVGNGKAWHGLLLGQFDRLLVENMVLLDVDKFGVYPQWCSHDTILNCRILSAGRVLTPDDGYTQTDPDNNTFGYGIIHSRTAYSVVRGCHSFGSWHGFDAARGTRDITYHDCHTWGDAIGFSTHEGQIKCTYIDCTSDGGAGGLISRSRFTYWYGGFIGGNILGTHFGAGGWEIVIDGCTFQCPDQKFYTGNITPLNMYFEDKALYADEPITWEQKAVLRNCRVVGVRQAGQFFVGNEFADLTEVKDSWFDCINRGVHFLGQIVRASDNTFRLREVDSFSVRVTAIESYFQNNSFLCDATPDGVGPDHIEILRFTGDNHSLTAENNYFTLARHNYRIGGDQTNVTITATGNTYAGSNRCFNGAATLTSVCNKYMSVTTRELAYSEALGTVLTSQSGGDYFGVQGSLMLPNLPTTSAGALIGQIWNDSGTLKVREV